MHAEVEQNRSNGSRLARADTSLTGYLGALREIRTNAADYLTKTALRHGDIVLLPFRGERAILVNHPEYIQYLLHSNYSNYVKRTGRWRSFRQLIGDGLLTSDGETWLRQRQRIQPAFHQDRLAKLAVLMTDEIAVLIERWRTVAAQEQSINVLAEMKILTLSMLVRTMFGKDVGIVSDAVMSAIGTAYEYINPISFLNLFRIPNFLRGIFIPRFRRFEQAFCTLDSLIYGIVKERRERAEDRGDLLSMIINSRDEDSAQLMSEKQVRDEVITMFTAGHEPAGIALAWIWYALSRNPRVEHELHREIDTVLAGRTPTLEDLPNLKYTRMLIQEALRLYPPVWAFDRRASRDDELGGYKIPANSTVIMSPYVMHRHPAYWDNPDEFSPERFADERSAGRPIYAYFPFGGGARRCVGFKFAMMQLPLIVAGIAQHFRLQVVPGYQMVPCIRLNYEPRSGPIMTVQFRNTETRIHKAAESCRDQTS